MKEKGLELLKCFVKDGLHGENTFLHLAKHLVFSDQRKPLIWTGQLTHSKWKQCATVHPFAVGLVLEAFWEAFFPLVYQFLICFA